MTAADQLAGFVREALAQGRPRGEIEAVLRNAGWRESDVRTALAHFADVDYPVPVPRPEAVTSPREAFLYLVAFSTLYLSAWHLGNLLFQLIDLALADPAAAAGADEFSRGRMRWSVASLLVAFPVFLYASWQIRNTVGGASRVGRWLTWITLFLATLVLVGNFTALLYNLLGGALTGRFVLKVAVVAILAGSVFGYYLRDLRRMDASEEQG